MKMKEVHLPVGRNFWKHRGILELSQVASEEEGDEAEEAEEDENDNEGKYQDHFDGEYRGEE
jgi:hypothetical protein